MLSGGRPAFPAGKELRRGRAAPTARRNRHEKAWKLDRATRLEGRQRLSPADRRLLGGILCAASLAAGTVALAQRNPLARFAPPPAELVNGRWNGVDLERRSNCTNAQNDGTRGTYAQFDVAADPGGGFTIAQSGITGLECSYFGRYEPGAAGLAVQGTYSCSDGKQGDFRTTAIDVSGTSLDIQLTIQLRGSESCAIDGILSMARFPP